MYETTVLLQELDSTCYGVEDVNINRSSLILEKLSSDASYVFCYSVSSVPKFRSVFNKRIRNKVEYIVGKESASIYSYILDEFAKQSRNMTITHITFLNQSVNPFLYNSTNRTPWVFVKFHTDTKMFRYIVNLVEIVVRQRHFIWVLVYVYAIGILTVATCSIFSL
jgi:hypothetical protein